MLLAEKCFKILRTTVEYCGFHEQLQAEWWCNAFTAIVNLNCCRLNALFQPIINIFLMLKHCTLLLSYICTDILKGKLKKLRRLSV